MKTFQLNNGVAIPALALACSRFRPPKPRPRWQLPSRRATAISIPRRPTPMRRKRAPPFAPAAWRVKKFLSPARYEAAKASLERSLARLDIGYIDLMLLHQPFNDIYGAWRALEEYQAAGKIRAIGVSNFTADRVLDLGLFNKVMPAVKQIEINPFHQQTQQVEALLAESIVPQAWGPFAEGKFGIFSNPVLSAIAAQHSKSIAQVVTRWLLERNIVVLAKSTKPERMAENLDVLDFALDDDDKAQIATLDVGKSQIINHTDLAIVRQFKEWVFGV